MARYRQFMENEQGGAGPERRSHIRYAGDGLLVMIDGQTLPAADISLGGVRVYTESTYTTGAVLPLRVVPVLEESMKLGMGAKAEAQVVGFGENCLRMVFMGGEGKMARLVKAHARRQRRNHPFPQTLTGRGG